MLWVHAENLRYRLQFLQWISIRTQASLRVSLGFPHWLGDSPRCSQTYQNCSHDASIPFIRGPSYSEGRPECPPRVWFSPGIHASKFTLRLVSHTPVGSQRLNYILRMKMVCLPFILIITRWPMNIGSASSMPCYKSDHCQPAFGDSYQETSPSYIPTIVWYLTSENSLTTQRASHWTPPNTPPITLHNGLQVHLLRPLDHGLRLHCRVHSIIASNCTSNLTQSWPPSSQYYGIQVHLQVSVIRASECMSEFTWLSFTGTPEIALKHRLQPVQIHHV